MLKGTFTYPFFLLMKTIFLLLFSLIIGKISIAQNQDWQKGDKVDLSEILPLRPTNGKTLNQSFFEQKVNILVFADLKNVEGLLLIDDLILLQKNYPKIQFSLFDEGPINSNNKFWVKNFNQLFQPNFPVISDDSLVFKKLKVEQTPSVFVFKPNQSFIGKMQIEELPNMLEPFFAEFEDSTKTEVSLKPIFSSKNNFKTQYPFNQKLGCVSDSELVFSNWSDTSINQINIELGKILNLNIPEKVNRPFALYYADKELWFSDIGNHNIYKYSKNKTEKIFGNGKRETFRMQGKDPRAPLNFPMDLLIENNVLYTPLAGAHQIWEYYLNTENKGYYFAGDANYAAYFKDGFRYEASLRYPIDVEKIGNAYFFIDAGLNYIRQVETGYLSTPSFNVDLPIENPVAIAASDLYLFVLDGLSKKLYLVDLYTKKVELYLDFNDKKYLKKFQFPKDIVIKQNNLFVLIDRKKSIGKINLLNGNFSWIDY